MSLLISLSLFINSIFPRRCVPFRLLLLHVSNNFVRISKATFVPSNELCYETINKYASKEHLFLSRRASRVPYLSLISSALSGNRQQAATFSRSMENRQNSSSLLRRRRSFRLMFENRLKTAEDITAYQ